MRLSALLLTAGLFVGAATFVLNRLPDRSASELVAAPITPSPPAEAPAEAAPTATQAPQVGARTETVPLPVLVTPAIPKNTPAPLPASAHIPGIRHEYQRLNNCGPVTVGMALSRWGGNLGQDAIAPKLKANPGDVNVSPEELAAFARSQGMAVHLARNGDRRLLRRLLAAGYPVIVETWFVTEHGGMGHYRLLTGYDDAAQKFSALDSYLGRLSLPYTQFDELWRPFGRTFLVVSPPGREAEVRGLLGFRAVPGAARQEALRVALAEAGRRGDAVGWLNVGQAKLSLGDARGAARAFDQAFAARPDPALDPTRPARVVGGLPWRTLWYASGPLEAYTRTGRYADVLRLTGAVLRDAPAHEEAHYWRGRALAGLGRGAQAQAAYREALRLRPGYGAARTALGRL
ncbi:Peptidase C39 [Deinococcus phoenicis]|uniref:Peptidase C39 n=1 Tax=Deinococcus phoenicis TaxID=1476583 RepID=A0A016QMX7_9DEIO|nr:C39 family peptidase [Deinococcus phoenicis]EYB67351.1 Peptidase C39 [Deinococcus phoenicis]